MDHREKSVSRETILPGNSHDERIDATTLKDLSVGVGEGSDAGFVIITAQNKVDLKGRQ